MAVTGTNGIDGAQQKRRLLSSFLLSSLGSFSPQPWAQITREAHNYPTSLRSSHELHKHVPTCQFDKARARPKHHVDFHGHAESKSSAWENGGKANPMMKRLEP
ncbi:hypothetical protein PIB30_062321 [Stylosanthes scabra]|uniref:Uncharacterized protein n=1 Tax=Stylosanthes scabra TaxID=79078 RepID=A0ABU6RLX7_9FABA|nr:hypothetical protein [Stylosanthes scabra]